MRNNKIIISVLLSVLLVTVSSCQNVVYKKGVEYPDYPDKYLPVYDDSVVFFI